jgi:hypothetical protein
MLYRAHNSFLYYRDDFGIINDYYQTIVTIIKTILENNPELHLNIVLCEDCNYNFSNANKTVIININYEHTLVKRGGRSVSNNTPFGNVDDDNNEKYFVRIDRFEELNNSDIIIDYSNPNIYNVNTCPLYENFQKTDICKFVHLYSIFQYREPKSTITYNVY